MAGLRGFPECRKKIKKYAFRGSSLESENNE
jgi:hypothetical protein